MSDSNRPKGNPPPDEPQEELNYHRIPDWEPPGGRKKGKKDRKPLIPVPENPTLRAVYKVTGYALTNKLTKFVVAPAMVIAAPFALDQHNGAISSYFFPKIYRGEILTRTTTAIPPAVGPVDKELCYNRVAELREKWTREDGDIVSPQQPWQQHYLLPEIAVGGVQLFKGLMMPPLFQRPDQEGLRITDTNGTPVISVQKRSYRGFDEIAPVIVRAIARAEGRGSVDAPSIFAQPGNPDTKDDGVRGPNTNHAIDWPRFGIAIGENAKKTAAGLAGVHIKAPGASTPPVQTVKNWAWKDGRTKTGGDKFVQMEMAGTWAYRYGENTTVARKEDFVSYLNTGMSFGRHRGLKEGMAYFYGNTTYDEDLKNGITDDKSAMAFRQVLTLIMALPNPSESLLTSKGYIDATERADAFLRKAFVDDGVMTRAESERVLATSFPFEQLRKNPAKVDYSNVPKSVQTLKNELLMKMRMGKEAGGEYQLNNCDIQAESANDSTIEAQILADLQAMRDPAVAEANKLVGDKLLPRQTKPYDFDVSITAQQVTPQGQALVRINVDTMQDKDLNLNTQGRYNTGSTNKWFMLGTYEQFVFAELWKEYKDKTPEELEAAKSNVSKRDPLTMVALSYLTDPTKEKSLTGLLDEAVGNRKYSAALACFFTGEGMNCPHNYEPKENGKYYGVNEALWFSVNLSWYRITSDIQEHTKWHKLKINPNVLDGHTDDPAARADREKYLKLFAQHEGGVYQGRAFVAMRNAPDVRTARIVDNYFATTQKDPTYEGMAANVTATCDSKHQCNTDAKHLRALYEAHVPAREINIGRLLADATDHTPASIIQAWRAGNPDASYSEIRAYISDNSTAPEPFKGYRKEFDAAQPDRSLVTTNMLAVRLFKQQPASSDGHSLGEKLVALYGARHAGANRAATREFVEQYCPDCTKDTAGFNKLHRTYVATPETNTQADEISRLLATKARHTGAGLASVIFSVQPHTNFDDFTDFMKEHGASAKGAVDTSDEKLRKLFAAHAPRQMVDIATIIAARETPEATLNAFRQINPHGSYQQARRFVSQALPASDPFRDYNRVFSAITPDASPEQTDRLASYIKREPKPTDPDAARTWFSPEEQLAALYGMRHPGSAYQEMRDFIVKHCGKSCKGADFKPLHALYKDGIYNAGAMVQPFSLQDRAFLAKVHPMKLETGRLINEQPNIRLEDTLTATEQSRIEIYNSWLINPKKLTEGKIRAQNRAINIMLDRAAWGEIEKFWHTIGYPQQYHLVPSLATVIGVSGSNTDALTTYSSIVLHGGETVWKSSFTGIHIGTNSGNPHELHAQPGVKNGARVLDREVAEHLIKTARGGIEVEGGTGRRLFGVFKNPDGTPAATFGKTGTSADSSTGNFRGAFWTGGTAGCWAITVGVYKYNPGPADKFTSALAAQILKSVSGRLQPMLDRSTCATPILKGNAEKQKKVEATPSEGADKPQPAPTTGALFEMPYDREYYFRPLAQQPSPLEGAFSALSKVIESANPVSSGTAAVVDSRIPSRKLTLH